MPFYYLLCDVSLSISFSYHCSYWLAFRGVVSTPLLYILVLECGSYVGRKILNESRILWAFVHLKITSVSISSTLRKLKICFSCFHPNTVCALSAMYLVNSQPKSTRNFVHCKQYFKGLLVLLVFRRNIIMSKQCTQKRIPAIGVGEMY